MSFFQDRCSIPFLSWVFGVTLFSCNLWAADTHWNVAGPADWNTAANWTAGVPDADKSTSITNGGISVIDGFNAFSNSISIGGSFGNGGLRIMNGGSLIMNSTEFASAIALGGSTAEIVVDASTFTWTEASSETLIIGNTGGNGTLTLVNGGVLNINRVGSGDGTIVLGRFGGTATLNIGTGSVPGVLNAQNFATNGTSGVTSGTGVINFNHSDANYFFTKNGTSSGQGINIDQRIAVNQVGTGRTTLISDNTYSGGTTISSGTLQIGNGGTTGSITGNITNNSSLIFNRSNDSAFGGVISGNGSLTKQGGGTLVLSGNNTYSGGTTVAGGTLRLGNDNAAGTGNITTTGSVISYGNGTTINNPIILNSDDTQLEVLGTDSATQAGNISELSGPRPLEKIGNGTLTLTGSNTYSGNTTLREGTLVIGNNNALGTGVLIIEDGTTLSRTAGTKTITNGLVINGNFISRGIGAGTTIVQGDVSLGTEVREITMQNFGFLRLEGVISGTGGLTVSGSSGDLVIANTSDNNLTGLTTVRDGASLFLRGSGVGIGGDLMIESGSLARIFGGADEKIADTSTVTANGTFSLYPDSTETIRTLNGSGEVELYGGPLLAIQNGTFSGVIFGSGTIEKKGNGTLTLSGNNSYTGGTTVAGGTLRLENDNAAGTGNITTTGSVISYGNGITIANPIVLNSNDTQLEVLGTDSATQAGNISELNGPRPLEKIGTGTLALTGNNTYTGGTNIENGTLAVSSGGKINHGSAGMNVGTGAGQTGALTIGANSSVTSERSLIGFGGIGTAEVSGTGALWTLTEQLYVGTSSNGTLSVHSGGRADIALGLYIGNNPGVRGNVTISGAGSEVSAIQVFLGVYGDGELNLLDGGVLTVDGGSGQVLIALDSGATGVLNIGNGGAAGTLNAATIGMVGPLFGTGTVNFNHTGTTTFATRIGSIISVNKLGSGTTILTGNNIYTGGTIVRGGTLALNSGGSINHSSANLTVGQAAGDSATFSVGSNGSLSAFRGFFGLDEGASGLLGIVDGNATFADELYIGYTGNGTLELSGNGTLSNTKAFIGVNSPSVSSANITGGVWTNTGELTVGYGGRGSLAISGNGSVSSAGAFFGFLAASNGNNATITGPGSSWTSTGTFYLGNNGSDNALEVLGGGSLLTGGADFLIGANSGSGNNSLTIRGNGSNFSNNATLYVGRSGVGNAMVIEDGAGVTSRNVRIGGGTGSNGTTSDNFVTVNGTNSTWTIGGTLRVGSNGDNSTLTISNGASVGVSGNSFLGYDASSDGNAVLLSGNGSKWTVNALTIGRLGTNNTVTVSEGGNLTATSMVLAEQGGSSGTLRIGTGGAAGSVSATQITGGNGTALVEFNHSDTNLVFNPILAGSLGVQHIGTGTTTFNATSTYSGGTTISAGTVRTQNASALGSGLVTLDAGTLDPVGTLNISSLTWNGGSVASGLGTATDLVNLSGNLTLGGSGGGFAFTDEAGFAPNTTYTILSAANMDNSLLGLFSGNSLLGLNPVFSRSGLNLLVNFAGSSSGPLLQNVGGPWTPTTADFVVNGPVQTGNSKSSNTVNSLLFNPDSSLQVFNNLTVTSGRFNVPSGSANLNGGNVITPADFNKLGDGNLIANSNFQVGGAANIQNGGLFVNGQFSTPGGLTVFQNALLGGSGVIVGNVFNNGIVNPGNSPGTLTINGNFSQGSSGTLQIEIASPSVFDRLVVSGSANLDGTLQILNLGKRLKYGQRYAFLQAGSINGEFDQILMPQPGTFRGRFLAEGGLGSLVVAPTSYTLVAETPNQRRVAKALDSYISARSGDREVVSIALDIQSEEQYPYAFEQIAPGFYESLAEITIGQAFAQTQMINQRLSSVRLGASGFQAIGFDEQPLRHDKDGKSVADAKDFKSEITNLTSPAWAAWAMGTGIFAKAQGISGVPNYRYQAGGFLTGADYAFGERGRTEGPSMTAGIYGGYNYTYAKYSGGSSMQVNSALFGLYGTYAQGGFYADAVIGGGYNGYKANRSIEFSTVDRTARSSPAGGQFNAAINLGYDWKVAGFTFGPIAGLQYTYAGVSSFTEQGADSLDLQVGQQNANSMMMTLGGRVAYTWNISKHIALIPEARIFWQHEFLDNPRLIGSALDGGAGPAFNFQTSTPDRDSVFTGAGITAQFGETWNTFFFYNADFGSSEFVSHAISGGLGVKF